VPSVNPIALALLNVKLPNGRFLIPTPQAMAGIPARLSRLYREDQFNSNVDYRINKKDWLAVKFFFLNSPTTLAVFTGLNVPAFLANKRPQSISFHPDVHTSARTAINEARIATTSFA